MKPADFLAKHKTTLPAYHTFSPRCVGWQSIEFDTADLLCPDLPSLYMCFSREPSTKQGSIPKPLYIGISTNLRERFLSGHHKFYQLLRYGVSTLKFITFPIGVERKELELTEASYLWYLKTTLNTAFPVAFSARALIEKTN